MRLEDPRARSSENAAIKRYAVCTGAEKGHDTAHSPPITSGRVKRGILLRPPLECCK